MNIITSNRKNGGNGPQSPALNYPYPKTVYTLYVTNTKSSGGPIIIRTKHQPNDLETRSGYDQVARLVRGDVHVYILVIGEPLPETVLKHFAVLAVENPDAWTKWDLDTMTVGGKQL